MPELKELKQLSDLTEIKQQLQQLQEKINDLEKKLENTKWQPKPKEEYWYIGDDGNIFISLRDNIDSEWRISQNNVFETEEHAKQYRKNLKTKVELKALADELNGEEVIDWSNLNQDKYYLIYAVYNNRIGYSTSELCMISGNVYCLDENFKTKAIERIGEQRLIDMIKAGV
jgi:hypothetical protein